MKIPETNANVGAYYANEENGQWQANGVIIDSGVGGGVVGSGDAGVHRAPVYPVPLPRGHIPGPYVMAGAYYPPESFAPAPQDDFADYMWMENEEEFDKQVMQQLEEEALMEQCIEAMLEDEQREQRQRPVANGHNHCPTTSNGQGTFSLEETISRSTLNPLAAEFVPNRARPTPEETTENHQTPQQPPAEPQATESTEETSKEEQTSVERKEESKAEEPPQPTEPPEVSAADVLPIDDKKKEKEKKEPKKPEVKKPVKVEVKKTKPIPVKKSEVKKVVKKEDETVEVKQSSPQPEETPGIKPINYAAAAKAVKPKKPSPASPASPASPTEEKRVDRVEKKITKDKPKTEKPVQRKNSAK